VLRVHWPRLLEFLKAELYHLGKLKEEGPWPVITRETILQHSTPVCAAKLIAEELPSRFATRINQMKALVPEWESIPELQEIHNMLWISFRNLRLVEPKPADLSEFTELISDLRQRHKNAVPIFAKAAKTLRERGIVDDASVDEWLGNCMRSRMGTEMCTAHYMSLLTDPDENHVGIVDTKCDPARICAEAIRHVQSQFADSGVTINLRVQQPDIEFSFISKYLFFIVEELLMNSACATLARAARTGEPPKAINVLVCEDPRRIGIKISDEGGGVPVEHTDKIWEYMFSTTPADLEEHCDESSPLSGSGMGLPLCRLYTEYLGGSLHLMSMPGVGTDVYMFLNRIDAGAPSSNMTE